MSLFGVLGRGFHTPDATVVADTLEVAAVDQADGTGATVTVSNSSGGTVEVFASPFSIPIVWSSAGTRSGDGTLDAVLGVGNYLIYAQEPSATDISPVVAAQVTSGAVSVYERLLDYCVARVKTLALPGLTEANVRLSKTNWNKLKKSNGCFVMPVTEIIDPYTNTKRKIRYGVQVTAFTKSQMDDDSFPALADGNILDWRAQLMDAFEAHAPSTVPEIETLSVVPGAPVDVAAFAAGYDAEAFVLRGRESRSYSA